MPFSSIVRIRIYHFRIVVPFILILLTSGRGFSQIEQYLETDTTQYNLQPVFTPNETNYDLQIRSFGSTFNTENFNHWPKPQFFSPQQTNNRFLNRFAFRQEKSGNFLQNMGGYEHYINKLSFNAANNFTVNSGVGFVKQYTIFGGQAPIYQFSLSSSIEYAFNDNTSAYIYGQYVTQPLGKPDAFFDPFLSTNPLFLQSEFGAGVKTKLKKSTIDFFVNKSFISNQPETGTINTSGSGFKIGF